MLFERHSRVIRWLQESGLASPKSLAHPGARLTSRRRRNEFYEFTSPAQRSGVFIKLWADGADGAEGARHEYAAVQHMHKLLGGHDASSILPTALAFDEEQRLCAFHLISGCTDLRSQIIQKVDCPVTVAASLGSILACLHQNSAERGHGNWIEAPVVPWVLKLAEPSEAVRAASSMATEALWSEIARDKAFVDPISELARDWHGGDFVHGDARLENILIQLGKGRCRHQGLFLVDWELASPGDGLWDAGCVVASFLETWIRLTNSGQPTTCSLEWTGARLGHFWGAYAQGRGWPGQESHRARCIGFAAARLIQYAFETTQVAITTPRVAYLLLQVAENLLAEPHVAAARLLSSSKDLPK